MAARQGIIPTTWDICINILACQEEMGKRETKQFDSIYLNVCVYMCACVSLRMNVYLCIGMKTLYEQFVEKPEKLRCSKL